VTVRLPDLPSDPIAEEIREFAVRRSIGSRAAEIDRSPEYPRDEFRALGEAGLLGLRTPIPLGGRGLPLPRAGIGLFHLAYRGGTMYAKLSLQPEFGSVLADQGSPALVERWFRPMTRGDLLVGNHLTEPGAGSDVGSLTATARREGDSYVLSGVKSEAAFAAEAEAAIVYAKVPSTDPRQGITAFLVPQALPGVVRSVGPGDLGEHWQRRGTVEYQGVRVPVDHRLGEEGTGFDHVRPELTRERALLAAIYLGVARASWEETVAYVGERSAFGTPLSSQEAVAFPLVEDQAALESTWLLVADVLRRLDAGESVDAAAAYAKWLAVEVALRAIDHAIQFHGGRGYSRGLPHEQRWRDVRSGRIAHGPSEVMLRVAARELWSPRRGAGPSAG
jgi:alkylation response protein AidB-like acyl-CoA dehydrogenase